MNSITSISLKGTEHDFTVERDSDGSTVARVWHSDRGEWTIDTVDGPSYTRRNRDEAIDLVADLVRASS